MYKIQLVGLEGSGKTSLAKVLAFGDVEADDMHHYPFEYSGMKIELSEDTNVADLVLFCLDGSNLAQLPQNKGLIAKIVDKLIVVQTKSDIQTIDEQELRQFLGLSEDVPILPASSSSNEGIEELKTILCECLKNIMGNKDQTSFEFEAQPRVVQSRNRYRQQNQISKPQQTFLNLMKDKKIKQLTPMQQEQEYIRLEKERIKMENMTAQLNSFKNIAKKDTYDIKATANPRIEVNLEFFLTDTINTLETQVNTLSTQTDVLIKKPQSPKYVPKKTGIDTATQVEDYELFNFDREVTPILNVICTKTLEQASLEIEQEEEFKAMYEFKQAFENRRKQEKIKQQDVVKAEKELIQKKQEIVRKYSQRQERIIAVTYKIEAMKIAKQYLKNIQNQQIEYVYDSGFYENKFQNQLNTQFMDWIVNKTQVEVEHLLNIKQNMKQTFDGQFDEIYKEKLPKLSEREKKKKRQAERMINYMNEQRAIRVFYQDEYQVPTIFGLTLSKYLDGTYEEWRKTYDQIIGEMEQKFDNNEINEEDYCQRKRQDYPDVPENYMGISVNNFNRLAFSFAHDQYYKIKDHRLTPCAILFNNDGTYEIIDAVNPSSGKSVRYKKNFRLNSLKQSDDEAIILRLQEINNDVDVILFGLMLPDLQNNIKALEWAQNARFGLYDSQFYIPFAQNSVLKTFKLEELLKQVDEPEQADLPQISFLSCFVLTKRFKQYGGWNVENAFAATKGMWNTELDPFFEKLNIFIREQYDFNLERDRDIIINLVEREKEKEDNILNKQDVLNVITKAKLPILRKIPTQPDSNDSVPITERVNRDEPTENLKSGLTQYTHTVEPLIVNLGQEFEYYENAILAQLNNYASDLVNSCTWGFELKVKGSTLQRSKQIIRIRELTDLTLHKKPEPPQQKEEVQQQQQDENQDDQDNND